MKIPLLITFLAIGVTTCAVANYVESRPLKLVLYAALIVLMFVAILRSGDRSKKSKIS